MVLVSHDHSFVFLKTTKTAGTSVEMALEPFCAGPEHVVTEATDAIVDRHGVIGYRGPQLPAARLRRRLWRGYFWRNHMPAREVRYNLGRRKFDRYTKMTVVRNPFDRLVSQFFWANRNIALPADGFATLKDAFRDYALNGSWGNNLSIVSVGGKVIIDRAIRMENMADDLAALAEELGLTPKSIQIPLTKSQARRRGNIPVAEYYDHETIDCVRRCMAWVFDNYDYADIPPNPEPAAEKPKVTT